MSPESTIGINTSQLSIYTVIPNQGWIKVKSWDEHREEIIQGSIQLKVNGLIIEILWKFSLL